MERNLRYNEKLLNYKNRFIFEIIYLKSNIRIINNNHLQKKIKREVNKIYV